MITKGHKELIYSQPSLSFSFIIHLYIILCLSLSLSLLLSLYSHSHLSYIMFNDHLHNFKNSQVISKINQNDIELRTYNPKNVKARSARVYRPLKLWMTLNKSQYLFWNGILEEFMVRSKVVYYIICKCQFHYQPLINKLWNPIVTHIC